MTRDPEIIAHRGAPREALENTLPAFQAAMDQGADGIELDVHVTRDGVVVVHHDSTLPIDTGGGGSLRRIADLLYREVLECPLAGGASMPTLDAALQLIGTRANVYVEVKSAGIERPLVECLARHPDSRVAVHAFDHRIPVAVRALRADIAIGVLSASYPLDIPGFIEKAQAQAFWQQAELIDRALVIAAHALGARLVAWTENDDVHARALIAMGVDALCTDTPGQLRAALGL